MTRTIYRKKVADLRLLARGPRHTSHRHRGRRRGEVQNATNEACQPWRPRRPSMRQCKAD